MYEHMMDVYQASHNETDEVLKEKLSQEVDSLYENTTKFQEEFLLDNLSSPVAVYLLSRIQYGKNANDL